VQDAQCTVHIIEILSAAVQLSYRICMCTAKQHHLRWLLSAAVSYTFCLSVLVLPKTVSGAYSTAHSEKFMGVKMCQ